MNLKSLNDKSLVETIELLAREERAILTKVLHHFREIDRRRLYSALGYKSLFDFATKHLGYPEDQAYRRLSAMKMLKEIPEIEDKIASGEITLTHIGLAHSLFRQEKKLEKELSRDEKLNVLDSIANKPVREAERITLSFSSAPQLARPERVISISTDFVEMKFTTAAKVQGKIEILKGLLAHKYPSLTTGELFEQLCDLGIEEWTAEKTAAPRKRRVMAALNRNANLEVRSQAQISRDVYRAADCKCENCGSTYALEVDHINPRAKGGFSDSENLRVLCRSCNQRAAIEEFGQMKMDEYLN